MKQLIVVFLLLLFSLPFYAQKDSIRAKNDDSFIIQKKFDTKKIEEYKNNKNFNYTEVKLKKEPTWIEKFLHWLGRQLKRFLTWTFGNEYAPGIFSFIIKALPYVVLAIVLFLMLKFFLKVNTSNVLGKSANKPIVNITEEEELIKTKDLPKLIQQAIEQKNFRLAVRYYYLLAIKKLEEKELIVWEQQKTNEDYIKEITGTNIQKSFKDLTKLYDFVWYGNFEINEVEFAKIETDFKKTNNLIKK
ncbi:hypothetical protein SAMN05444411_110130 [Lutibacter oricola]|uniref:DUF4129 domain-containing protein n=1 Tax=Lutibacter oricola TaxID=762486 RepID=A0A1H3F7M6_9FLAO|nr:hypothetical protein [Lutibacter oricola]SDX86194.1 hypothetical protein SAMN05444411_110130 [Lutibacter oricola]